MAFVISFRRFPQYWREAHRPKTSRVRGRT